MKLKVYKINGEVVGDVDFDDKKDTKLDQKLINNYVKYIASEKRNNIANTLDRSEVRGGGKKPWKQKGTGRARHGSSRSPLWIGGGVTFGPRNSANYKIKLNKKAKEKAIREIINHFAKEKRIYILENLNLTKQKTKYADALIEKLKLEGKVILITSKKEEKESVAFRNLSYMYLMQPNKLDFIKIISADYIIFTKLAYLNLFNKNVKTDN